MELQGLAAHMEAAFGDAGKAKGVVIGCDHRALGSINSIRFGVLTATAFFQRGFHVHMFPDIVCTPMVVRDVASPVHCWCAPLCVCVFVLSVIADVARVSWL